jgi:putative oxidoreductase
VNHSKLAATALPPSRSHHPDRPRPTEVYRKGRAAMITAGALQVLLGFAIAGGGMLKLSGDPAMVEMFDDIGVGQWLRLAIGLLEVAGGVGVLIRRVRALAALCLLVLLIGATVTNIVVLTTSPVVSTVLACVALAILLLRRQELPAAMSRRTVSGD